jgi:hypothetical protein
VTNSGPTWTKSALRGLTQPNSLVIASATPACLELRESLAYEHGVPARRSSRRAGFGEATVDHGFSHSVVCIMAAQSYMSGRRLYWDPKCERITSQPV